MANFLLKKNESTSAVASTTTANGSSTSSKYPLKQNDAAKYQFPGKLMDMIMFAESQGLNSIISWVLGGRGFMIHDEGKNLVDILPKFFSQTKYRSLRRQLNMWHFQRILDGPYKGAFIHPFFNRGNKELLCFMSRQINFDPFEFEAAMEKEQFRLRPSVRSRNNSGGSDQQATLKKALSTINPLHQNNTITLSDLIVRNLASKRCAASNNESSGSSSSDLSSIGTFSGQYTLTTTNQPISSSFQVDDSLQLSRKVDHVLNVMDKQQEQQQPNDGDMVSFAGKNFFFLECMDKTIVKTSSKSKPSENVLETVNTNDDSSMDIAPCISTSSMFEPNAIFRL